MAQSRSKTSSARLKKVNTANATRRVSKRTAKNNSKHKLVVLIPAYNEATTIFAVIEAIPKRIAGISKTEIIVIDDGSTDLTANLAAKAGAKVVSHPRNLGVGQAMRTGLEAALAAQADFIVNLDADGQFHPRDLRLLLKPLISGTHQVMIASRFLDHQLTPDMPAVKYWGNRFLAWFFSWLLGQNITDVTCGFRAFTREAVMRLELFGRYTYTQEMFLQFARQNLAFGEVPVAVQPTKRPGGQSHVVGNVGHYLFQVSVILIRSLRDYKPFHFFGLPAAALGLLGLITGLFTLIHYLQVGEITPYKSLGVIALFAWLGSLLLFVFALLADMLDRIKTHQSNTLYYVRQLYFSKQSSRRRK